MLDTSCCPTIVSSLGQTDPALLNTRTGCTLLATGLSRTVSNSITTIASWIAAHGAGRRARTGDARWSKSIRRSATQDGTE